MIIIKAYDAWNYETALSFCGDFRESAITTYDKPWAVLANLVNWELSTPDTWEIIKETTQWAIAYNKTHEAMVYGNSLQKDMLDKIQVNLRVKSHFYVNENQANEYLKDQGSS